ncbi:MAG: tetratricopeptide repeat protein, partial [Nitrospinaceae bacterium]|nr:tetratricopeptide repeat protein [Nitrospinaceae bacterium]NIR57554.1 tetratricopeptide repeat protein [Nitrospinaceae bacterium]NIS88024.1 tetratricopeptide repeat protein [Nitrospinaceae bacterium]NIT84888.1 tetratricopeptide repeat protein [Nitrospinaceae bacterium]NIU47064.1 tetratricopeptide repeat protein [Nitrospinaceae bacterium]
MNSQQVFFHQTLGWVFEQMERQKPKQDYLERALHEYEIALALNDETRDPDNEANLLLNLGNGHYLLNNPFAAYHYYKQRKRAEMAFVDPNREAVYHRRFGESAFKAGVHEEALRQYQAALALFSEKKDLERMAELNDRIALVYQDLGDHGKAVEYFSNTLDLHQQTGNRVSLSRTLRNIANNLFELNREAERRDPQALNRALSHYFQAIENLERYGVVTRKKKEKRGLIDIELQAGLGKDVSAAATGFDKIGEQKLIFHYIGKIYGDFGEYDKAIDYFQKKLALIPDNLDPQKNIPVLLEKALLLNQIGNYYFRSGDYAGARPYFQDSYALSQTLDNRHGMLVNAANIGRVVFIQCQSQPLASLRQDLLDTVALLRAAVEAAGPVKEVAQPEYLVLLQNYRGIFYYYLGFHLSPPGQEKPSPALSPARLKAALGTLRANFDW